MPPMTDAFFAFLLAIPLYINLWLARPWNDVADPSAVTGRGGLMGATDIRAEPRGAGR